MKTSNILIGLTCMLIAGVRVNAQECYTLSPTPPSWIFNPTLRSESTTSSSYNLR